MPPRRHLHYNALAGTSVERLAALSDGVFAFALTLLVLDLKVPSGEQIGSSLALWHALVALGPKFLTWIVSFLTLGIFWMGQQTQLNHLERSDRDLSWLHLGFLVVVTMVPFTTALVSEFVAFRLPLLIYWGNLLALGGMLYATWLHARFGELLKENVNIDTICAIERRIVIGQSLYAVGAALCVFGPMWSIGFILAVQINYAVAPGIWPLSRL